MRSIVSILMENEPGALSRVVGLFSQRGYNIESLTVSPTDDPTLSRLNITTSVVKASEREQIEKQLHKLIDVLKVSNVTDSDYIERELAMIKVKATGFARAEVKRTADIFRGQIVDVTNSLYTVQLTGTSDKIEAFIATMKEVTDIIEVARSGVVGIARGERALRQ
ncbi:acetolactate synthase small subunit [Enterovibrio nigricans]|uniref:Acetolactate synthase small subunit n=1 Tax=Enterovibrio nigricans DSM 22720 TaxID=1121868 RepID=A0A1T4U2E4_9GAMM|nr:acetolactate synthase small subunit [Enterovibrio nigricans]PKF51168.1 acetolactate synthase small subunit [Enterovibrio nigricans]SKA46701.1 acetolactate synthase, small subunit [Enterovibrio nigricans DSM 22720]